jgi:hypothetical protein
MQIEIMDWPEYTDNPEEKVMSYLLGGQTMPEKKQLILAIDEAIERMFGKRLVFKEFKKHKDGSAFFLMHRVPDIGVLMV